MRRWTIPILGAVAMLVAVPATANARDRFGPGQILGAFGRILTAPLRPLIRLRPSIGIPQHQRRNAIRRAPPRQGGEIARGGSSKAAGAHVAWLGPVFWPHASDDMVAYVFFPNGANDRFWSYGSGDIRQGVFAPASLHDDGADARVHRALATNVSAAGSAMTADPCGGALASDVVDHWIERIEQIVQPTAAQRDALTQLRAALARASHGIKAACPADAPVTPAERLDLMQERLWAMHDAAITIRTPLDRLYQLLTDEQKARLNGGGSATPAPSAICGAETAVAGPPIQLTGRAARLTKDQRAGLEAVRMTLSGMAQFLAASCPRQTPTSPVGRLDAATDRLGMMLYAVMNVRPALDRFYESLNDRQKTHFDITTVRQQRSPVQAVPANAARPGDG